MQGQESRGAATSGRYQYPMDSAGRSNPARAARGTRGVCQRRKDAACSHPLHSPSMKDQQGQRHVVLPRFGPQAALPAAGKSTSICEMLFMKFVIRNCAVWPAMAMMSASEKPAARISANSLSLTLPRLSATDFANRIAAAILGSEDFPCRFAIISSGAAFPKCVPIYVWVARQYSQPLPSETAMPIASMVLRFIVFWRLPWMPMKAASTFGFIAIRRNRFGTKPNRFLKISRTGCVSAGASSGAGGLIRAISCPFYVETMHLHGRDIAFSE